MTTPAAHYPDLEGKVAVVTGGSQGIGAATCGLLVENGVKVAVVSRSQGPIDELVEKLGADNAVGISADGTDPTELARVRHETEDRFGPVSLLAPFAGGFGAFTPVAEMELDEWRKVIDDNLTSTFIAVKAFLGGMLEREEGSIVTMSSISARFLDKPTQAAYAASKAGVIMFTRHLALEVGEQGVRVNSVAPGTTMSARIERIMDEEAIEKTKRLSPMNLMGMPEDTANATVFLLSDAARWLTGVTIDVNGGRVML
jgi:3-oxoacyl-[acyl-carrier protein] reductase